jgi:hypothetical protein
MFGHNKTDPTSSLQSGSVRIYNGTPVEPDAAGCCGGLTTGSSPSGYSTCVSDPTTSGLILFLDTGAVAWAFSCDRHAAVLTDPRPMTTDDIDELDRRMRNQGRFAGPSESIL